MLISGLLSLRTKKLPLDSLQLTRARASAYAVAQMPCASFHCLSVKASPYEPMTFMYPLSTCW